MNEPTLFHISLHPKNTKPGMVMWAPEYGEPKTIKSINPIPPNPNRPPHHIDYGWHIEYTNCPGRTWPRHQEITIF